MSYVKIMILLTDVSSQDVLDLFLLKSPFDDKLVITIYGPTAKTLHTLLQKKKHNNNKITVEQEACGLKCRNIRIYLVPNSDSKKAKRCFGCRCNLQRDTNKILDSDSL